MGAARWCESIPGRFSFLEAKGILTELTEFFQICGRDSSGRFRTEDCKELKRGRQTEREVMVLFSLRELPAKHERYRTR